MAKSSFLEWLIGEDRYTRGTRRYYAFHTVKPHALVAIDDVSDLASDYILDKHVTAGVNRLDDNEPK